MAHINLFGLRLRAEERPLLEPHPGIEEVRWNARLAGDQLQLDIVLRISGRYHLELRGEFRLRQLSADAWGFESASPGGVFRFFDGPAGVDDPFGFLAAWISARSSRVDFEVIPDGYLAVAFPLTALIQNRQLPIALQTTGTARFTLVLDPTRGPIGTRVQEPSLVFAEQAFEVNTHVGARQRNVVHRLFAQTWLSAPAVVLPIDRLDGDQHLDVELLEGAERLPLYGFRWEEGVSPAMEIATTRLRLTLGAWNDNHKLKGVTVGQGALRSNGLHDREYRRVDWRFSDEDKPVELAIQPLRSRTRLASFLIHPTHGHSPVPVRRVGSGPLLGTRDRLRFELGEEAALTVLARKDYNGPPLAGADGGLLFEASGAVLTPTALQALHYAIAGDAYVTGRGRIVRQQTGDGEGVLREDLPDQDFWRLAGSEGSLPCLPDEATAALGDFQRDYHAAINETFARGNYADAVRQTSHESRLLMGEATAGNRVALAGLLDSKSQPVLAAYTSDYRFGHVTVTHTWEPDSATDYFFVYADGASSIAIGEGFALDPTVPDQQQIRIEARPPGGIDASDGRRVLGLVKLQRGRDLSELLRLGGVLPEERQALLSLVPQVVQSADWIGCILFRQALDFSRFEILGSLVEGALHLEYLALSPSIGQDPGSVGDGFSAYGRLIYENLEPTTPHPSEQAGASVDTVLVDNPDQLEVLMQTRKVDVAWADRRLVSFLTESWVSVRTCLGLAQEGEGGRPKPVEVSIVGAMDQDTNTVRFLARSNRPVALLPEGGFGPIKQLYASRLEIIRLNNETKVDVDGDAEFQPLQIGGEPWFDSFEGDGVKFNGFGFRFDRLDRLGSWLKFDYPSFQFRLGKGGYNLLSLPFIKVKLKGLGIDFDGSGFDWNSLVPVISGWEDDWNSLGRPFAGRFKLGLELAKLPALNAKPFGALSFDFDIGIGFENLFEFDLPQLKLHLGALGFERLDFDLMRFLSVRAEKFAFDARTINDTRVPWFSFKGVEVDVLEKNVINRLDFHFFSVPSGERGFLGLLDPANNVDLFLLQIDWVLIGNNLSIPQDLANAIVSIRSDWDDGVGEALREANRENQLIPVSTSGKVGIDEWLFAAGLKVLGGALTGKFLFQDGAYYGIALEGQILREWFGWDFAVSVLYIQRERPEEDAFYIEFRVPTVSLGAVALKGGIVALEIQMNGGFLLDIGFPWLDSTGIRNWDRAHGAYLSGILGAGGLYIAKRRAVRRVNSTDGQPLVMLGAGQAAMVGIGGAYRAGPFRVEAYAGIYMVGEGAVLLRRERLVGLRLVGAVGIQVRGIGELNWWIISIRIDVVIGAEARLTLIWGIAFDPATGIIENPNAPNPPGGVELRLDFRLYARVSARACIGKGWFKICKGISAGVSLPYRQTLRLGA